MNVNPMFLNVHLTPHWSVGWFKGRCR